MARPYIKLRTAELNRIFQQSREDAPVLRAILAELENRDRPKALDLKRRVKSQLGAKQLSASPPQAEPPVSSPMGATQPTLFDDLLPGDHADTLPPATPPASKASGRWSVIVLGALLALALGGVLFVWVSPDLAPQKQAGPSSAFDDTDAQLRVRQAASAVGAAAREVEALRKALSSEQSRVVQTDGERDLNQTAIKTLENQLRIAETARREKDAALKAAQDARAQGLSAEAERLKHSRGH